MKRRVLILLIALFIISCPVIYIQYQLLTMEKEVIQYLLSLGVDESELLSVKGKFGYLPFFSVKVVFKDEPDITYYYTRYKDTMLQLSKSPLKRNYEYKHLEKEPSF